MTMESKAYRCKRCGGPLEITPETIVAVCEYCGYPNWMKEVEEDIVIVSSLKRSDIERAFKERVSEDFDLSRIKDKIDIIEVKGIYVPFYFITVKATARYAGYVKRTRKIGSGKKARIIVEKERVSGRLSSVMKVPVLARRSAEDFSITELAEFYKYSKPKVIDIREIDWSEIKLPVLNAELTSSEAADIARDEAGDKLRGKAKSKVDELTEFHCITRVLDVSPLTLIPYWYLVYRYGKAQYKAAYAGWSCHLLAIQEPVLIYHRLMYFLGALSGCALSALLMSLFRSIEGIIIGLIVGIPLSYGFGRKLVSDVRIEREI